MFAILTRLVNSCWFGFKWSMTLAALIALLAVAMVYDPVDRTLCIHCEAKVAAHYRDLRVRVQSAEIVADGIMLRGLSVIDPSVDGPAARLAHFDEIVLHCRTDVASLVRENPEVHRITIRRPTLRATLRPDGSWSVAELLPLPKFSNRTPTVIVEGATIELIDPNREPPAQLTLRDGRFELSPLRRAKDSAESTQSARPPMAIRGRIAGDHVHNLEVQGVFDAESGAWEMSGKVVRLDVTPELVDSLPGQWVPPTSLAQFLRGQAAGDFWARHAPGSERPLEYRVAGRLARGRVDDPRLPHPLTDLQLTFQCTPGKLLIDNVVAACGAAKLRMSVERAGLAPDAPFSFAIEAQQLELEERLAAAMPAQWSEVWDKFRPKGKIDLDVRAAFDGQRWTPQLVDVQCHDVAFMYYEFPYPLEHGRGRILWKDDRLKVDRFTAYTAAETVRIDAEIDNLLGQWSGWAQIDSRRVQLDKKLFDAVRRCDERHNQRRLRLIESFRPSGTVNVFVRVDREAKPNAPVRKNLALALNGCSIAYDQFPYRLHDVHGVVRMNDDDWAFQGLRATNDAAHISCEGRLGPGAEGRELSLHFDAKNVALDAELRDALRLSARQLWYDMSPVGAVDLRADVTYRIGQPGVGLRVDAAPVGDSVSITPSYFPVRLEKVHGDFHYEDGRLTLSNVEAAHSGGSQLHAAGQGAIEPGGAWRLELNPIDFGWVKPDRDLLQAMPERLRRAVTAMDLRGAVAPYGRIALASSGVRGSAFEADWDLTLELHQASVRAGVALDNIFGAVRLAGRAGEQGMAAEGELDIQSVTFRGLQVTALRGPFSVSESRVLLGRLVPATGPESQQRNLTGEFGGGSILADGWIGLGPAPHFEIDASLNRADLSRCVASAVAGRHELQGQLDGQLHLQGEATGAHTLGGYGSVQLRDADIYDLPIMVSLLKLVSLRLPDTRGFTRSDVDFHIDGEHIYLDKVDFNGDAISLNGRGEVGLDKQLNLVFRAVIGQDRFRIPVVSDVLGGASEQILQIQVVGPLDSPQVSKHALPLLGDALEALQTGEPVDAPVPPRRTNAVGRQLQSPWRR